MSLNTLDALVSYAGLVSLATASVYLGSLSSFKPPKKKKDKPSDDSDSEDEEISERLSSSDAVWFPVIGSVVLGGFYLAFKYLGDDWINKLMGYYFLVTGIFCVWNCLISASKKLIPRTSNPRLTSLPLKPRLLTLLLFPLSTLPSLSFFLSKSKSAFTTDVLALSFAHTALSTLKLDTLRTGCILLGGLFFYDIWWVFGTSVMVTVATSLDVPIKLLFPRSVLSLISLVPAPERPNMLLGLGDVVIPGTLVALAHRLDKHLEAKARAEKSTNGPKGTTYLHTTLIAYSIGLSMAFAAMHLFQAAQPALLYLRHVVPFYCP
ncbi:signal peptide peptidase domain-containing protein [Ceratobasidium sp. AG-Ba]|nr:signal peptide peptidase domain-containing protein [Ceratobasidium sp. AG-Ba]QRW11352.1 signal peptide peptidase domain-containing protein [Ceratobasidium sp. AG-Ba]